MKNSKLTIVLLVIVICFLLAKTNQNKLQGFLCDNTLQEAEISPNRNYMAVVYVRNCGATTGWVTELAIVNKNFQVKSIASVISNNGEATPKSIKGWPLIKPIWIDDKLEVYHSANADLKGLNKFDEIEINYNEFDQTIIDKYNIEIR